MPTERPPPTVLPVGSSSDDSISTVATTASTDSLPFPFSHVHHPYSSMVYTPPARQKDQYIDDEELLSRRFDGLGIRERAAAESAAKRYEGFPAVEEDTHSEDALRYEDFAHPSFATFAFPPSASSSASSPAMPLRHTSLPAIVTSAAQFAGLSASSPIDPHAASPSAFLPLLPSSSASLTGSAISLTPDGSPGQSPVLSSSPFPSLPLKHQPFHQRAATTSDGSNPSSHSSISPRTASSSSAPHPSGMTRSGSTPNAAFPSSSGSSYLQSPIARSASSCVPPWAVASAGTRPGSAGTSSTTGTSGSSRPWVFDSDASSVCSANSAGWSSGGGGGGSGHASNPSSSSAGAVPRGKTASFGSGGVARERRVTEDGEEFELDEGGEVFKPESDVEFLDHRPEPPGAKLSINRDDPHQVVLKVTLPGFSLDNITVAMRRGHKVHIVADSYGETGGHFEKLVHLGSDVSSVAPRAEFNGTDLNVYIARRPSRPSSSASTAGGSTSALPPFGMLPHTIPGSPSSTFSSPDLDHRRQSIASSFASAWSLSEAGSSHRNSISAPYPLSPSLEYPSPTSSSAESRRRSEDIPPPLTVFAPPLNPLDAETRKSKSRSLTGPEGAKAAAKAAREEAAMRAKEEAKKLPTSARGGRRLPFRRQKEDGTFSASSGSAGEGSGSGASDDGIVRGALETIKKDKQEHPAASSGAGGVGRNGTIKATSRSNSPLPPAETPPTDSSSSLSSSASSIASSSVSSPASSPPKPEPRPLPLFTNPSNPHHTHPRPKMREGNLTLRAPDGQSFVAQAQHQWNHHGHRSSETSGNEGEREGEGDSLTPRWEEKGMRFHAH
ncbi:hypothetical protein JCM11491_002394 [Sporobolomyces phaffii]